MLFVEQIALFDEYWTVFIYCYWPICWNNKSYTFTGNKLLPHWQIRWISD